MSECESKFGIGQRVMVANPLVAMVADIVGGRGYYGHVTEIEFEAMWKVPLVHVQLSGCVGEPSPIHALLTDKPMPFFEPELEAAD